MAGPGWHALELHVARQRSVLHPGGLARRRPGLGPAGDGRPRRHPAQSASSRSVTVPRTATTSCTTTRPIGTSRFGPVGRHAAPSVPAGLAATPAAVLRRTHLGRIDRRRRHRRLRRLPRRHARRRASATSRPIRIRPCLASTAYSYTVRARDTSGNPSAQSAALPVTTPAPAAPVFADGFESGDFSAWTTSGGLTIEGTDVRSGGFAAEGVGTTFARKTLSTRPPTPMRGSPSS